MKKLLAALIVATMLISCMSVMVFAVKPSVSTASNLLTDFYAYVEDDFSEAAYAYQTYVETAKGLKKANAKAAYAAGGTDPLYTWIYGGDETEPTTSAIDVTSDSYICVPVFLSNVCSYEMTATYDDDYLTLTEITFGTSNAALAYTNDGVAEPIDELVGFYVFTPVASATGDAEGKATTNVTFNVTICKDPETNSLLSSAGNLTCAVPLTGLTPSASTKPEKITADSDTTAGAVTVSDAVTLADTSAFTASAGDDAALLASKANVVNNLGDPDVTLYDGTYQIFFGTNNYSGVTSAPTEVGLALYEDGNFKGLYRAQSIVEGKWGILFFGLNSAKTYTTKQYVKYDGEDAIIAN